MALFRDSKLALRAIKEAFIRPVFWHADFQLDNGNVVAVKIVSHGDGRSKEMRLDMSSEAMRMVTALKPEEARKVSGLLLEAVDRFEALP